MEKNMAVIENGTVTNIIWCSPWHPESDTVKHIDDRPVAIGDTYENGDFFRSGVKVLTPLEQAQAENEALRAEVADKTAALATIYSGVTE